MEYQTAELFYLINLPVTTAYCLAMLIYLNRRDAGHPTARALQRLLIGVIAWAFYDVIISRIARTADPAAAFFWFRFLSFMWVAAFGLSADVPLSLARPVTPRLRVALYAPVLILYLVHLARPDLTSGRIYGIPGGWPTFPAPWGQAYQVLWVTLFLGLGIMILRSARAEYDPRARREKYILLTGMLLNMGLLYLSRVLLERMGPGFPALGNASMTVFTTAAFIGVKRHGRVISPQTLYRTTVDNIPSGLGHVHRGIITWTNKAFREMLDAASDREVLGRPVGDLVVFRDGEKGGADVFYPGRAFSGEVELAGATGRFFLAAVTPLVPGDPEQGVLVVLNDITERKKAENDLRESELKFYTAFRSSPLAITISLLENGRYVEANEGVTRMYGFSVDEVLGGTSQELGIWGDRPEQEAARGRILEKEGRIRHFEFQFRRKNGEKGTGLNFAEIIRLDERPYLLSMTVDISERKKAEEALRKSEERYRTVLDASPFPVAAYDLEGRCLYLNPSFTKVFGWTLSEVMGRRIDFVPPECLEETREKIKLIVAGQSLSGFETKRYTKDGRLVEVRVSAAALRDYEGRVEGAVVILQDVSAAKQAEEDRERLQAQLRQSQKMEAIGTLASGVSHDFNNILQLISGNIQIISARDDLDPRLAKHAREIEEAVGRARDLVHRLLTFSRKVEPELKPVDLNQEVLESVRILERILPKMIEINVDLTPEPSRILADSNQIYQVLMNLATNARDAMPGGGRLGVSTGRLALESGLPFPENLPQEEYVMLRVRDDGLGMDEETRKNIFNPFFTTKEIGKGTGLGLAAVYGIVHGHGGWIKVESQPGKGSAFEIYWPARPRDEHAPPAEEQERAAVLNGRETILVVDDEPGVIAATREYLELNGYRVLSKTRGEEAVEIYREARGEIDLVVMDLGMPGIGGLKALELLREVDPGVRVVIASGYVSDHQVREALAAGAAGFVGKPYRLGRLLEKVREVLDGGLENGDGPSAPPSPRGRESEPAGRPGNPGRRSGGD
ncbi:MAG: PAS domain S-box protein [Pseudomonadota bacterium]